METKQAYFIFGPWAGEVYEYPADRPLTQYIWVECPVEDFVQLQRYVLHDDAYVFEASKIFGIKSPYAKAYPSGLTKDEIVAKEEAK